MNTCSKYGFVPLIQCAQFSRWSITIFVIGFLSNGVAFGQKGFLIAGHGTELTKIEESYYYELERPLASLDSQLIAVHFMALASQSFYLGIDSTQTYLKRSMNSDGYWFCHFTRMNVKKDLPEAEFLRHQENGEMFLTELPSSFLDEIWAKCDMCCDGGRSPKKEVGTPKTKDKLNELDHVLLHIEENDQKYRKLGPEAIKNYWVEQNELDSINRVIMDSIYRIHGFPSQNLLNDKSQEIAWFVLHHSADCAWNSKWIPRYSKALEQKLIKPFFICETLNRFYNSETGICKDYYDLSENRVLSSLKDSHPELYESCFGN